MIHELYSKGYSMRQIAKLAHMDRRTVRAHLEKEYKPIVRNSCTVSKLEPYKQYVREFIAKSTKRIPYSVSLSALYLHQ